MIRQITKLSRSLVIAMALLSPVTLAEDTDSKAKTAFENNCLACHQLKKFTVGPSLVEIRKSYPAEQKKAFLAWAMNPGRKRPEGIQMPSMAHVGEDNLALIHDYILKISKGVKVNKSRHQFSFKPPAKTYPYIKRSPMAFASPAAIGVVFSPELGVSWDSSVARMEYAFVGHKPFFYGEGKEAKLSPFVLYRETAKNFWSFANDQQVDFQGYRVSNNLPEFVYQVGDVIIKERYQALANGRGFIRAFSLTGVTDTITVDFAHQGNATLKASVGILNNSQLTLTAQESKSFTIEVSIH